MTKAEYAMLEKLFAAEIDAALSGEPLRGIVQSKSKLLPKLEADGLVRRVERVIQADRSCPFPVRVSGWELTLAGNAAYCLSCA
jgi:hypothetical protein